MKLLLPLRGGVYALPVLIVAFAVLAGGSSVARAMGDEPAAVFMGRTAFAAALLLVVDLVFLVGILALRALNEMESDASDS